jgi:hypothetical protein
MKITLISTIYNLNPYISIYIDSINSLSNKDISYILVDANSADNIREEVFNKIDIKNKKYIRFPFKENYYNSIISAIDLLETDYFFILDTDDAIKIESIDLFNYCIESYKDVDIFLFSEKNDFLKNIINIEKFNYDIVEKDNILISFTSKTIRGSMTSKLMKKDLISDFKEHYDITYSPDILLSYITFLNSKSIIELNLTYHVSNVFNSASLNRLYNQSRFNDYKKIYEFINTHIGKDIESIEKLISANQSRFFSEIFYDFVMVHSQNGNLENLGYEFLTRNENLLSNSGLPLTKVLIMRLVLRLKPFRFLFIFFRAAYITKFKLYNFKHIFQYYKSKIRGGAKIYDFNSYSTL